MIGSRNDDFVSGATDLRGVFVADGIRGRSTVIAQAEPSRYAFFRGQTDLVPAEPTQAAGRSGSGGRQVSQGRGRVKPAAAARSSSCSNSCRSRTRTSSASRTSNLKRDVQEQGHRASRPRRRSERRTECHDCRATPRRRRDFAEPKGPRPRYNGRCHP